MKLGKRNILSALIIVIFGAAVSLISFQTGNAGFSGDAAASVELSLDTAADSVKRTDESGNITIDFEMLKEWNPDIYAWITVPGTSIDYPVLQKSDAEDLYDNYYLDHTVDFKEGLPGAIYSQPVNQKDFMDSVTVLYGHNMKNGEMFTGLHEFEDRDFFEKNRQILIYTPERALTYEIFAAVDFSDALIPYEYSFSDSSQIQKYLEDVRNCTGNFLEEVNVSEENRILTLSTCYSGLDDRRLLIEAVLTDDAS